MGLLIGLTDSYCNSVYVTVQYNEESPPFSLFHSCGYERKQGSEALMMLKQNLLFPYDRTGLLCCVAVFQLSFHCVVEIFHKLLSSSKPLITHAENIFPSFIFILVHRGAFRFVSFRFPNLKRQSLNGHSKKFTCIWRMEELTAYDY